MQDPQSALTQFEQIRQTYPTSTAAQYGVAKALDELAELKRSNALVKRAIDEYKTYISLGAKLNDTEFKVAAERCINRMRFIGNVFYHLNCLAQFYPVALSIQCNIYC